MVLLAGCAANEPSAADEVTGDEASESSAEDPSGGTSCEGGPACGAEQVCIREVATCECDEDWSYCDYGTLPGGCLDLPEPCAGAADLGACLSDTLCGVFPGAFEGDVFVCAPPQECHGDCDLDPGLCEDTGEPTPCGDVECSGDEVCVQPGLTCECDANDDYCDFVLPPLGCVALPQDCAALDGDERTQCLFEALCAGGGEGTLDEGVLECSPEAEDCYGNCDLDPGACEDTSSSSGDDATTSDDASTGDDATTGDDAGTSASTGKGSTGA